MGLLIAFGCVILGAFLAANGWFVKTLVELKSGQAVISQQMENNGGKTLRDAIDRIEANQDNAQGRMTAAQDKLDNHLIESARVWARVDALASQSHVTVNTNGPPA